MPSVIARAVAYVDWARVLKWQVFPAGVYLLTAYLTEAEKLNPTEILVLIALSGAVTVAFLPQYFRFFKRGEPVTPVGVACLGIFAGWVSNILRPAVPLAVTLFPSLQWLRDSDAVSAGFAVAIYAGFCHLLAPAVTEFGEIPPRKWAKVGAWVGVGLLAALIVFYWPRFSAIWQGRSVDQFRAEAPWRIPGRVAPSSIVGREPDEDVPLDASRSRSGRLTDSVSAGVSAQMWDRVERHRVAQGERSTAAAVRDLLGAALDAEDRADLQPRPGR